MSAANRTGFSRLTENTRADVCVVGAGIAGLTTAYRLTQAGKSVVVLDDGPIAAGETERTTAHLTAILDDRYCDLARLHGEDGARVAAESHSAAIDTIEEIVQAENICCDFERVDAYLFPTAGDPDDLLDKELNAARSAGLKGTQIVEHAPVPLYGVGRALRFPRQAQFHPIKYLSALAQRISRNGGRIFTDTHVTNVKGGKSAQVETEDGFSVGCDAIVIATNTPIMDRLVIHTKQAAYRTYVVGLSVRSGTVPRALYWDTADPYHYVRIAAGTDARNTDAELLIVGGEDHKTGQADDAEARYGRLEQWARQRFPQAATGLKFRWSGQVVEPVDGLAYIGRNPLDDDNVFVATGTSGNGITYGTIAGILITGLIVEGEHRWAELYSPSRVTLRATSEFVKESANMAAQYFDWLTAGDVEKERLVAPGTGAVVRHGLTKLAVYRAPDGSFHECSAVCPHLGGIVSWNHAEQTWDCPAHGSRFDCFGRVVNGPANSDLRTAEHISFSR